MSLRRTYRFAVASGAGWRAWAAVCLAAVVAPALSQTPQPSTPVVLDRVVAVVNNQAILSSDLNEEMHISVLEPNSADRSPETPQRALQRLISRALIRQQIREEDAQATELTAEEIAARLDNIRKELPVCVRQDCATDAGWKAFLENHDLTQKQVVSYLRNRLEILHFIEMRFRQGISISHQEKPRSACGRTRRSNAPARAPSRRCRCRASSPASPAAIDAAEPPDDPPGVCATFHGLEVLP